MPPAAFSTPILLIIFNRPEPTRLVFESIRSMRPKQLFIAADGPRPNVEADQNKCAEARKIVSSIDWDCEVHTLFRDHNLGCGRGVSSAITWFFENVEGGIILEDDCLPSRSFYFFCQELLAHYRNQPEVMHISGNNFQYGRKRGTASYYFSRYTHNWGWATWRRAWKHFDFNLAPEELQDHIWDLQWRLSVEKQHGVAILPNLNLVKNIGFGLEATHTKTLERAAFLDANEIDFPLIYPKNIDIDKEAEKFTYYVHFRNIKHMGMVRVYEFLDFLLNPLRKLKRKIHNSGYWNSGILRDK